MVYMYFQANIGQVSWKTHSDMKIEVWKFYGGNVLQKQDI